MSEIKVTNVTLEKISKKDSEEYLKIANDEGVRKFFKLAYCRNISESQDVIETLTESNDYIAFKILNKSNEFVGLIIGEKKPKKIIEISYFIGKEYRKKEYCSSAIIEFAKYMDENTDFQKFEFCISLINDSSKRVMSHLGIRRAYIRGYEHYRCYIKNLI